ncbi:UNVERIFIED_CONTAM: chitin deacetylase [Siphonaria sp. JEL0065]|nr:chitin deacetylase [Siphonaria sp. JEL0065]
MIITTVLATLSVTLIAAHPGSHEKGSIVARGTYDFSWAPPANAVPPINAKWSADLLANFNNTTPGFLDSVCSGPVWGLTYDDGPSAYTDDLLAHLAAKNVKATFMVIGSNVLNNPDVLLRTYQAGHQIGIHTWSHPDMASLTVDQQIAELVNTAKIIKQVTGVVPTIWRPPFYSTNANVLKVAAALGLRTIVWSLDSQDWAIQSGGQTPAGVLTTFQNAVNSGTKNVISLEHDGFSYSEAVAPQVLDILTAPNTGISIATIKDCLGLPQAYGGVLDAYLGNSSATTTTTTTTVLSTSTTTTTTNRIPSTSSTTTTTTAKPTTSSTATTTKVKTTKTTTKQNKTTTTTTTIKPTTTAVSGRTSAGTPCTTNGQWACSNSLICSYGSSNALVWVQVGAILSC